MKAIETTYNGTTFRSRLEARWATFFDVLEIPWTYEPEGYELSFRRYVPDFLLPECGTFLEVRGSDARVDLDELARIGEELPAVRHQPGCEQGPRYMLLGPIPPAPPRVDYGWLAYQPDRRPWFHDYADGTPPLQPTEWTYDWPDAIEGYQTARTCRFWDAA